MECRFQADIPVIAENPDKIRVFRQIVAEKDTSESRPY